MEKVTSELPVAEEKEYQLPPKIAAPSGGLFGRLNKLWLVGGGLVVVVVLLVMGLMISRGGERREVVSINEVSKRLNSNDGPRGVASYKDSEYGFIFDYPNYWSLSEGNLHDLVLPATAVTLESGNSWIVIAIVEPAEIEVGEESFFPGGGRLVGESDFQEVNVGGAEAKSLIVVQEIAGKYLKTIYTRMANKGKAFYFSTSFPIDSRTKEPVDLEGEEAVNVYNQVLNSFRLQDGENLNK